MVRNHRTRHVDPMPALAQAHQVSPPITGLFFAVSDQYLILISESRKKEENETMKVDTVRIIGLSGLATAASAPIIVPPLGISNLGTCCGNRHPLLVTGRDCTTVAFGTCSFGEISLWRLDNKECVELIDTVLFMTAH